MAYTDINSEDRLVQATFAAHLEQQLGWESIYAWSSETFGPDGTLGRNSPRDVVLVRDLRAALARLNPELPAVAIDAAVLALTSHDPTRSLVQHNRSFHVLLRDGVPVSWRDAAGQARQTQARVIDFDDPLRNRFLVVREPNLTGLRTPNYNRRADLVCFVNGLPLVFIELKAVYVNIRAAYEGNLKDYLDDDVVAHAFHHNAFIVVSNGSAARYGSITSEWDHYAEWKRLAETDQGSVAAEVLLNGMLDRGRLLDLLENFILFDESKAGAVRKVVVRNHQVLGVNLAVEGVLRQAALKAQFPPGERLLHGLVSLPLDEPAVSAQLPGEAANDSALDGLQVAEPPPPGALTRELTLIERAHPDLARLNVLWHTQGSGKSYSMRFFAEKVRRKSRWHAGRRPLRRRNRKCNWRPSRHSRSPRPNWQGNESRTSSATLRATVSRSAASRSTPPAAGSPRGRRAPKTSTRFTPRALWAQTTGSASCKMRRPSSMRRFPLRLHREVNDPERPRCLIP